MYAILGYYKTDERPNIEIIYEDNDIDIVRNVEGVLSSYLSGQDELQDEIEQLGINVDNIDYLKITKIISYEEVNPNND